MDVLLPEALCLVIMDTFSVSMNEVFVMYVSFTMAIVNHSDNYFFLIFFK